MPLRPARRPRTTPGSKRTEPAPIPSAAAAAQESPGRPEAQTGTHIAVDSCKTRTYGPPAYPTNLGRIKRNPHPQSNPPDLTKPHPGKGVYSSRPAHSHTLGTTLSPISSRFCAKTGGGGGSTISSAPSCTNNETRHPGRTPPYESAHPAREPGRRRNPHPSR